MSIVIKGLLALLWLVAVPFTVGIPFLQKKSSPTPGECFLSGYLVLFSLMEILTLPMTWFKMPLHALTMAYGVSAGVLAVWGIICNRKNKKISFKIRPGKTSVYLCVALILILVQMLMCVVLAHMDADDCMYVATATTSVHTDTIFQVNPYTGKLFHKLPKRYVLSPFPIFLAVISQLSAGLHPAITAHMVIPAVFLPASYLVQYMIGKRWFKEDRNASGIYLLLVVLFTGFSAYSVYNAGTFQMVRLWQGKALLAAMMLPLLFYLCMSIFMEKENIYPWVFLAMANLSCCLLSSMGVILAPVMAGCMLIVSLIINRNFRHLWKTFLCFIPSLLLGVIYLCLA